MELHPDQITRAHLKSYSNDELTEFYHIHQIEAVLDIIDGDIVYAASRMRLVLLCRRVAKDRHRGGDAAHRAFFKKIQREYSNMLDSIKSGVRVYKFLNWQLVDNAITSGIRVPRAHWPVGYKPETAARSCVAKSHTATRAPAALAREPT